MLLALLCLNQSCNDEPDHVKGPRAVSFSLGLARGGDASGRIAGVIPDGSSVLITLTKPDGTPVLTREPVSILTLGNGYVTAPLSLEPGDYTLTDFWIVQDSSAVLFLTPKAGSPMAEYVSHPLPLDFSVAYDAATNVPIEVVGAGNHIPEDFGYASFQITPIDVPGDTASFRLTVFMENGGGGLELTSAAAIVTREWDTLFNHYTLTPGVNAINLTGTGFESGFRLFVNKPGYLSFIQDISAQTIAEHANEPLTIVLHPVALENSDSIFFGGSSYLNGGGYQIMFDLEEAATFYVEWGDGITEKFVGAPGTFLQRHWYEGGNEQPITVRGDLDKVIGFQTSYAVTSLDISALINLKRFATYNPGVNQIDLSQTKLEGLWIAVGSGTILLPEDHNLKTINISSYDTDYVSLVNTIYTNAVNKNIRNGSFLYGYDEDNHLSQAVIDQLESLRADYDWYVGYH